MCGTDATKPPPYSEGFAGDTSFSIGTHTVTNCGASVRPKTLLTSSGEGAGASAFSSAEMAASVSDSTSRNR